MDKVTFNIPRNEDGKWGSYISKYPADSGVVQPSMFTSGTRNVITSASGQADKRLGGTIWNPNSGLSGPALDQYEAVFDSGTRLFLVNDAGTLKASTGNGSFTSITAGYTNPANFEFVTYQSRAYGCNGVDNPIVLDIVTSYGGVSYSFTTAKTRTMGAAAPGSAATAARNTDSTASQVPAGSHTYKITYVYYNGVEESNGGSASSVCVNDATHTSNALTAIPVGGYGVTARNIYRDNNDGNWLLLGTLSNNTATTYTDILPVGSTPTPIPSTHNVPGVFKYVALYLDRLFVIDVTGKKISWSTAGEPDVFDPANEINGPQDDVMTSIYIFNGIPYVFGQHTLGTVQGTTDGSFYYSPISQSVGCVDNRSIQTRSIVSVPTLMWLAATPNKGIYYTNGSTVQYLSDFIEDLTFNLAQISYLERSNTQATQAAFQGGTASSSIDLVSNPGVVQTINPVANYSHAADWATGTPTNLVTAGDTLQVPTAFAPTLASGSASNLTVGANLTLTASTAAQTATSSPTASTFSTDEFAEPIIPTYTGTLTGITWYGPSIQGGTIGHVYADNGSGSPDFSSPLGNFTAPTGAGPYTAPASIPVTAGTRIWVSSSSSVSSSILYIGNGAGFGSAKHPNSGIVCSHPAISVTFQGTVRVASGTWTSPVYDVLSAALPTSLTVSGSYPASTAASIVVQGSANQSSWTTTDTLSSPNGTASLTGGTYRYWRIVSTLTCSATPPQSTPSVGAPVLKFGTTGTWVSPAILCTTDITALSSLVTTSIVPAGTSVTTQIRTSADASSWSAYSAIGSASAARYAQIKITLVASTGDTTSPTVAGVELDWAVTGTLVSSAIDTGTTPAGWSIFQYNRVGMAGTVAFQFRSAASSGALSGASFSPVINGGFPTSSPLEFCQWKAIVSSTANNLGQVNSVTANWLLSNGANVRAASLFFNKSYYLSVATQGSAHNNTVIELDYQGNWRVHSGMNAATMGTYFNDAFYCDSTAGNVLNAFKLPTDNGTNITFDLRTKCFAFGDDEHLSIVRSLRVKGVNTGTTVHAYYSVDRGVTWVEMLNSSGSTGYATTNSGTTFNECFVPDFSDGLPKSGTTVTYRLVSSDAFPCQILKVRPTVYVRKGKYVTEANA